MNEEKTRNVAARLTQSDYEKLHKLMEKTQQETNMRVTITEMLSKLIRDAYDKVTE